MLTMKQLQLASLENSGVSDKRCAMPESGRGAVCFKEGRKKNEDRRKKNEDRQKKNEDRRKKN